MELAKEPEKDDDRTVLLEGGGGLQAGSPRARNLSTSSPIVRCVSVRRRAIAFEKTCILKRLYSYMIICLCFV